MRAKAGEILLAATSVGSVVALLLLAEGGLRWRDPGYFERRRDNAVDRLHTYSDVYGWAPRPGARAVERGALTEINTAGYRGPLAGPPSALRRRVVLVGDSTAFGYGVRDEDTYARRLEREAGLEVVNLGVEGFGPDQSLLRLEREGLAFGPREVVFSFCVDNDFADAAVPAFLYDGRHPKPYFTLAGGELERHDAHLRLGPAGRLGLWLSERSQLYLRLAALLGPRPAPVQRWRVRRDRALADGPAVVELVARLVLRMRAVSEARGAAFTLLLHPSKESYHRGSELALRLRARLEDAGVGLLDLSEAHHTAGRRFSDFAFDPTGHLSPAGHAAVAAALQACWQARF